MDRIPPLPRATSKTIESAMRLKDVTDRARAARPVETGRDILRSPSFDADTL